MEILMQLNEKLDNKVQTKVDLSQFSTINIGGSAEYFYQADTKEDIVKAIKSANEVGVEFTILSGASNILINSNGIDGLVIKMNNTDLEFEGRQVKVGAACPLQTLVDEAIKHNLMGLESLTYIPGTVGGAIYGNAGAYGREMSEFVQSVEVYNGEALVEYSHAELKFAYRDSILKNEKKGEIIVAAVLELEENKDNINLAQISADIIAEKDSKHPRELPSLGCVFKNVNLKPGKLELLHESQGSILPRLEQDVDTARAVKSGIIPAGILIEALDLKGYKIGGIQVSEKHANFLVNIGGGTSDDMVMLMSHIKSKVRDTYGIQLVREIQLVGF